MDKVRVRTESMIVRLSKKSISEGFELLDKGYVLGAMRLFMFKADTAPPFEAVICFDCIGQILLQMGELEDAAEHFENATERYQMIMQPILSELMRVQKIQATQGASEAIAKCLQLIDAQLEGKEVGTELSDMFPDLKSKSAMCRVYATLAGLYVELVNTYLDENNIDSLENNTPDAQRHCVHIQDLLAKALVAINASLSIGKWDRIHMAIYTKAQILERKSKFSPHGAQSTEYLDLYKQCIDMNGNYILAYEKLLSHCSMVDANAKSPLTHDLVENLFQQALSHHPKSDIIVQFAYFLSDISKDNEGIALLDKYISEPPNEEGKSFIITKDSTEQLISKLYRAKAAILADNDLVHEAIESVQQGLALCPSDELSNKMLADLNSLYA